MLSMRIINYAIPPEGHFWSWSDGYDAIEWADGRTLAIWPEAHSILQYLGNESGIPPLGSVLLVLAACRDDWSQQRPLNHAVIRSVLEIPPNEGIVPEVAEVLITGLDRIHHLPKDLRHSLSSKCHLVSALFEGGPHCLLRQESELVLQALSNSRLGDAGVGKPKMSAKARFLRDIRALKIGLARHDAASLESRLRTGLDDPRIQEPVLPEPAVNPGDPRDLLDRLLASGGEGGAAAAVAKRAIAMMNFPGRFGSPRDLPVGGIADITNRGTIDRLLPGELAWDDLVLAARLVHNEALYFRREIPPLDVALSHTVLLDRGLRLWGTGRVFSLGVALGLRHHPALNGPGETFEVVAATAEAFEYLELSTPAGVRAALETLVPAAGPDAFLSTWWDAAQIVDDESIPDLSFITAKEHLEEPATRGLLGEIAAWIHGKGGHCRVIALSRDGALEAQAWSPGGNRILFRGELDLDEILQAPPAAAAPAASPPPLRAKADPLPSMLPIYALERLPFLFPLVPQASAFLEADDGSGGGLGVSVNHRLMRWPQAGWGGEELASELPGRQHWIGRDEHGSIIVIASAGAAGEAVRVFRWDTKRLEEIEIAASRHPFPRHAAVSGGAVLLAYSDSVEALSLAKGHRVAELPVKALPAVPTLLFDGETITVIDSGRKPAFGLDAWSLSDTTRPRLLSPDRVSLGVSGLRVFCGEKVYVFDPIGLTWQPATQGPATFHPFVESRFTPAPGVDLKMARRSERLEIWHDSRGILHLRDTTRADPPPWSILLSTEAAAAWNPAWQLCAIEARLRLPAAEEPKFLHRTILQDFLECNQHDPSPR
jgi:hypothetical protein